MSEAYRLFADATAVHDVFVGVIRVLVGFSWRRVHAYFVSDSQRFNPDHVHPLTR